MISLQSLAFSASLWLLEQRPPFQQVIALCWYVLPDNAESPVSDSSFHGFESWEGSRGLGVQ